MRREYEAFIRLCYDKYFLEEFLSNRKKTINKYYPDVEDSYFTASTATSYGIEEEYYKRLATLLKTSKRIFAECHNLVIALYGDAFFEKILSNFFNENLKKRIFEYHQEILDPFDGYVIGPFIMRAAMSWHNKDSWWLNPLLNYKWGYFHAKRVSLGFPPLYKIANLVEGATLIEADFEIRPLLREVNRMENHSVSYDILRKRVLPKKGYYACVILPKEGEVIEMKLNKVAVEKLQEVSKVEDSSAIEDKDSLKKLSFVLSNSFLCCNNELCRPSEIEKELSKKVIPLPH